MTKAHAGILESDDSHTALKKLHLAVGHAVTDPSETQWVEGHLRPLVGLTGGTEGGDQRNEAFAAWRRFFESLAEQRPLVLVFEDLHWADDGLLDFVDHLAEWATDVPLLVVCTARPELLDRRPGWGGGKRNAATISLTPLADEDVSALIESLVGKAQPNLVAHAGGNPLYAEEYARMLAQSGNGEALALPDTVQGIIAARLDTLPLEEKALVHDAAVLGKVFWVGELGHVAGLDPAAVHEQLQVLERKEFVRRERRTSVAGETAYVFRHVLVRDVAYSQIPRSRRANKHVAAATWIESLAADRSDDLADLVAHHYSSALELARATGDDSSDLATRARLALRDAGDRAARLNAFFEAARFYGDALDLWPVGDSERPRLHFAYGRALFYSEDGGADVLAEAAEELLDAGDLEGAAEAQTLIGELCWIAGRRDVAFDHFRGGAALLADAEPSREKAHALAILARFLMAGDEYDEAIELGSEALRMADELSLEDVRVTLLNTMGVARVGTGDLGGIADIEASIELAERVNSPDAGRGYNNLASTLSALGELERSFELYDQAFRAAERFGRPLAMSWIRVEQADEHYFRGRWDEAIGICDELLTGSMAGEHYVFEVGARVIRALVRLPRGDLTGAEDDLIEALAFARELRDPQHLFPALAVHAFALADTGRGGEAAPSVDELLHHWRARPTAFASGWIANLAPAAVACGRAAELIEMGASVRVPTRWLEAATRYAAGQFAEAASLYAQIGSQPDEAYARLRAAEQLIQANRRAEADEELATALEFYRRAGAARMVSEAECLLAPT
jgi:tetratricopeptide (TPR) repeat protein